MDNESAAELERTERYASTAAEYDAERLRLWAIVATMQQRIVELERELVAMDVRRRDAERAVATLIEELEALGEAGEAE